MPKLSDYVGQTVLIRSIPVDEQRPTVVKLVDVEAGGIWIESQDLTDHWLAELKVTSSPKTLVWFLPYAKISWIMGSEDYPALSEKALGLKQP
jgi:hypothetical protein